MYVVWALFLRIIYYQIHVTNIPKGVVMVVVVVEVVVVEVVVSAGKE